MKKPWVCAGIFATIHILLVALPVISSGGSGEGQMISVMIFDFPFVLLLDIIPGGGYIQYSSTIAYMAFFSIAGTILHAVIGGLIGLVIDKRRNK